MSLRTRLIIAFLLLSVVPLSAVTFLSYTSSVRAFEQAAQREATESATDVSRRMEMVTADVGRRMDRLFVAGTASPERPFNPDPQTVRESVAPLLGDTAALVDRVEFHPAPDVPPPPTPAVVTESVPIPIPPSTPRRGGPGRGGTDGPPRDRRRGSPPPGSEVIVMDIPRIVEEATRAAAAAGVAPADPKIGQLVEKRIEQQLAANQASLTKMAETLTREAAARADSSRVPVDVQGRNIEVAVQKDGRVIGRANAMLNMDRTLKMVLGFARRDQGRSRSPSIEPARSTRQNRTTSRASRRLASSARHWSRQKELRAEPVTGSSSRVALRPGSSSASPGRLASRCATSGAHQCAISVSACSSSPWRSSASSRSRTA